MAQSGGTSRDESQAETSPVTGAPLGLLLLRASRWLDALLLDELTAEGWPRLTPAQTLVFAYLDHGGTAPSELARRLGQSRQAAAQLVAGLQRLDLVSVVDDRHRRRGRLVMPTDRGLGLAADAAAIYSAMEVRLGRDEVHAVRTALGRLPLDLELVVPDMSLMDGVL